MAEYVPWAFLDEYRGRAFSGEWPTLPEMFAISVARFADRPCFATYDPSELRFTYAEADAAIARVAAALGALGIGRGSQVAVTGKNSPEWAIAYLAILRSGAVVIPIDYQIGTDEIANLIGAGDAVALFCDEEKAEELRRRRPCLRAYFSLWPEGPEYLLNLAAPESPSDPAVAVPPAEGDLAAILFTSGTTGSPKGVMLSHRNLVADCYLAQGNMQLYPTDVFYALLPIHHSYTMLAVFIEAISVGAEVVFGKRMVVKQILKDLKDAKITMFLGVPLLFNKVLAGIMRGVKAKGPVAWGLISGMMGVSGFVKKAFGVNPGRKLFHSVLDKASLSTIRICISGGGPLASSVFRKYNQLGIDFVQGYGLTETSPILTLNPIYRYKENSVGKIIPRVEMKILDPDPDGVGEIAVKGPMVMMGYYKMPEETKAVFTDDGWFRTGDVGYMDDEQYVYLTGRAKNLIVTEGGKNVYPEEIENRFQLFEEVEQVLVRGYIADAETRAEGIEACIYPNQEWARAAGSTADARARIEQVVEQVNQKLLPYQRIGKVSLLDSPLEMTTTKKVKRFSVEEQR